MVLLWCLIVKRSKVSGGMEGIEVVALLTLLIAKRVTKQLFLVPKHEDLQIRLLYQPKKFLITSASYLDLFIDLKMGDRLM